MPSLRSCLSLVTLCGVAIHLPTLAAAGEGSDGYTLNPLVVASSPVAATANDTMRSVTLLTRADIERSPASNLADLLAQAGGVEVLRRGAPGAQADLGMRGSNFEQTLMLLDGVPIHNAQTGHHNLDIPVPLSQIERIEIIKGPGALQYGGSATGGVINIVTRTPAKTGGRVEVAGGSHASQDVMANLNARLGNTRHALTVQQFKTDGEKASQPTDVDKQSALYTGGAKWQGADLQWGAGTQESDFGAWAFYSAGFPDMREHTRSHLAWLGVNVPADGRRLSSQVYWEAHDDWFRTRITGIDYINKHKTELFGYKGDLQFDDSHGSTVVGTKLERTKIQSNALKDHERDETSLWLLRRQQLAENLSAEAGINRTVYSENKGWWLPSLALGWQVNELLRLFVSGARSARVGSYTELYGKAPNLGDANLKPERSDFYEAGADVKVRQHQFRASVFERRTKDWIDWYQPAVATPPCTSTAWWCAANYDDYRAVGQELNWKWQRQGTWLSYVEAGYEHQHVRIDDKGLAVKYATHVPRQTWRAAIGFAPLDNTTLNIQARRPEYDHQPSATLLAAKLEWKHRQLNAWLEGQNLLDKDIIETGFAPIAGRWLMAGVGYDF